MATSERSVEQRLDAAELERWSASASEFATNTDKQESRLLDQGYYLFFKTLDNGENPGPAYDTEMLRGEVPPADTTFSLSDENFSQFRDLFAGRGVFGDTFDVAFVGIGRDDDYKREAYHGQVVITSRANPPLVTRIGLSYRQPGGDWVNNERWMAVQTPTTTVTKNGNVKEPTPFFTGTELQTMQLLGALAKKYSDEVQSQKDRFTDLGGRDYA